MSYYQIRVKTAGTWGAWLSLAQLGASGLARTLTTCAADTVEFTIASATALTDASEFTYNAEVSLRRQPTDSTSAATAEWWFRGRVRSIPRHGSGAGETYRVLIEGPWSWFQSTVFRQAWPEYAGAVLGSVTKPRAILFAAQNGARVATGPQLKAICDAAVNAGAPCTVAAITGGITPPYDEQTNITCAQAVTRVLAYHPHAVLWFDYSTETPALKYAQRAALPAVSVAMTACDSLSIRQRDDLKVPAVAIYYEKQNSVDGASRPQTVLDKYPSNANEAADGVLTAVYDLRGDSVQTVSQVVVAAAWPSGWATSVAWWKSRVPWLRDYADADISLSSGQRLGDSSLSNIMTSGAKQPWMNVGIERERVAVTALLVARKTVGGVLTEVERITKRITIEIDVTGAPVGTNTYRAVSSFDQGEETPAGVAQSLYTEWSQTHYEGSLSYVGQEPDGAVTPGTALNITGGVAGWASMAALVSRVTEQVDSGATSVEFGPPGWVDVDARVLFERSARSRHAAASMRFITGADSSTGLSGASSPSVVRDGESDQERQRLVLCNPLASVIHRIDLDSNGISKSVEASTASALAPREMYLPYVDTNDGNKVKAKLAQVIASPLYGAAVAVGATELATTAPEAVGATADVGDGTTAARANHVHAGLQLASSEPAAVGVASAVGDGTTAARSNHVHAGLQLSSSLPASLDGSAAIGIGTTAARADHKHAVSFPESGPALSDATPNGSDVYGIAGVAVTASRGDHQHPSELSMAGADSLEVVQPDGVASFGSLYMAARVNHRHPLNVSTAYPAAVAADADAGTATAYARADHVHSGVQLASEAPADIDELASVGVATTAARADHVHSWDGLPYGAQLTTAEGQPDDDLEKPLADAEDANNGTGVTASRYDHRHPLNVPSEGLPAKDGSLGDAGAGGRGEAATYARSDHAHPLNVDASNDPVAVALAAAKGDALTYARSNHAHADRAPTSDPASLTQFLCTGEGAAAADTANSWGAGSTTGMKVSVVTRVRYGDADGTPVITAYYRNLTFDLYGRITSVSTEGSYTIEQPVKVTLSLS